MFSKATEYALRATIYISQKSTEAKKLGIEEISKAIDSPKHFTAKILQSLARGNRIVSSVKGPGGGFFITEKGRLQPVREVLMAMGEDAVLEKCVLGLKKCSETNSCPMHAEYKSIKKDLIALFETKTIQQLSNEIKDGEVFINNNS